MLLSVREMELRKIRFDQTYPPGEIEFLDEKLRQATPLHVAGSAELVSHSLGEVRIQGRLSVRVETDCDRCLEAVSYPIDVGFDLFYAPVDELTAADEVKIDEDETEVGFYQGEGLELADMLRERVLLELPMQRVCREDCKGICPACGQNRNVIMCGCQTKPADDRWAALKDL